MTDNQHEINAGEGSPERPQSGTVSSQHTDLSTFLTFRLSRLQANLNAQAADLLRRHGGVPLAHWRVLMFLFENMATTQKEIVDVAEFDKGQVSRIVERLIEGGYLVSESYDADKRVRKLFLTEAAHQMINRLIPVMRRRQQHLKSPFSQEDFATLFDFLDRLDSVSKKFEDEA